MQAMTIRELLTYLKSLPEDTHFPVGFGLPFIINNVTDQIIFRPKLNMKAGDMFEELSDLLGLEVKSDTGARSVIQQDTCYAYFGLDSQTVITPMNIVFLTILRAMQKADRLVNVKFKYGDLVPEAKTSFYVPDIWWSTLSKRHQRVLALEYLTNQVLGGFNFDIGDKLKNGIEEELRIQDAFGVTIADVD